MLDSVRRLLRIGATANLFNLLQKQHPADLAAVYGELQERDCKAAFAVLVERSPKLAMESAAELGPEMAAQLLADRPAGRNRQAGAGISRPTTRRPGWTTCRRIRRWWSSS